MRISTSNGAAWRAIYAHGKDGALRFSLGIDPTFKFNRARVFGSVGFRKDCTGGRKAVWRWSLMMPRSRHWWRLDGRRVK